LAMVFLGDGERAAALRGGMSVNALIGAHWTVTDPAAGELAHVLREAASSTAQRGHLRRTLDRINLRLASRPPDAPEHRRLVLSDRYLASLLEQAQDAILSVGPQGEGLSWNGPAGRLVGWGEREAVGLPASSLAGGAWADELPGLLQAVRASAGIARRELLLERPEGGTLAVEVTAGPVRDEAGQLI